MVEDKARISVIIPSYNEESCLPHALDSLLNQGTRPLEILVVDGNSTDGTRALAEPSATVLVLKERSISKQKNFGSRLAQGEILLFLHADCRLEEGALQELVAAMSMTDIAGGAFQLELVGNRPFLDRSLSFFGNLNAKVSGIYLGDHGIFCRRSVFMDIGGFPDVPLMYEFDFMRKLRSRGKVIQLNTRCFASARKFQEHGYWKTILLMRTLRTFYKLGLPTQRLQNIYRRM